MVPLVNITRVSQAAQRQLYQYTKTIAAASSLLKVHRRLYEIKLLRVRHLIYLLYAEDTQTQDYPFYTFISNPSRVGDRGYVDNPALGKPKLCVLKGTGNIFPPNIHFR